MAATAATLSGAYSRLTCRSAAAALICPLQRATQLPNSKSPWSFCRKYSIPFRPPHMGRFPNIEWTEELQSAFDALRSDNNLSFNAVAGAGKTTSFLITTSMLRHTVPEYSDLQVVYMAFNRAVANDMKKAVQEFGLENVVTGHTYHSAGGFYYDTACHTDQGLQHISDKELPLKTPVFSLAATRRLFVLDETQDMNPVSYNFIRKLFRDSTLHRGQVAKSEPQFLVLGDPLQSIYQYMDADVRFLTCVNKLFQSFDDEGKPRGWKFVTSSKSQRLSVANAQFINNQYSKKANVNIKLEAVATKVGSEYPRPTYVQCKIFEDDIVQILNQYLPDLKDRPADVLILVPSLQSSRSPAKRLMNILAEARYSVFIGGSDSYDGFTSPRVLNAKTPCLTFHQSKGLTFKAVVILGFDGSYRMFCGQEYGIKGSHMAALFVALTRATHRLLLFHDLDQDYLPCLDVETLPNFCDIHAPPLKGVTQKPWQMAQGGRPPSTKVTTLLRHLSERIVTICFRKLRVRQLQEPERRSRFQQWPTHEVKTGRQTYEEIVSVTSTALASYAELYDSKQLKMLDYMIKYEYNRGRPGSLHVKKLLNKNKQRLQDVLEQVGRSCDLKPQDMIRLSLLEQARRSEYVNKALAMRFSKCDWLTPDFIKGALEWIHRYIPQGSTWLEVVRKNDIEGVRVEGEIDVKTPDGDIYELKYSSLREQHILQAVCYAALAGKSQAFVLDCRSGQHVKVAEEYPGAFLDIVRLLVKAKFESSSVGQLALLNDDEFCKEASAGFPNFKLKCTIPSWLQSRRDGRSQKGSNNDKSEGGRGCKDPA